MTLRVKHIVYVMIMCNHRALAYEIEGRLVHPEHVTVGLEQINSW